MQSAQVLNMRPLSGGSINRVCQVELSTGASVVFKWHANPPDRFFFCEHAGLTVLRRANAIRVPEVYAAEAHGILMEWLPDVSHSQPMPDPGPRLGEGLAQQHRVYAKAFGHDHDNYVGLLPQVNRASKRWIPFFRDCRLQPQLQLAERLGRMNPQRRRWAERLFQRLPEWIDESQVRASLLHGDLWGGNWLNTSDGPAIIDPAVYFGDREMDLAMASLFGGFPVSFFDGYRSAYPLAPGHEERVHLYQLYYLLIHLNIFGESYGAQVDSVLRRYGA